MSERDYYEVLGVSQDATSAQIKKSYKRLAMKYHPDKNKDDRKASERKFKEAKKAYEVLSDTQKRQIYDQFGHDGVNQNAGFGQSGFSTTDFGDIFSEFFGGGNQSRQHTNRGSDLQYNLEIDLKQAVEGAVVKIRIPKHEKCDKCAGSGVASDGKINTCPTCHGSGQVQSQQGFFTVQRTCHHCHGNGKIIERPCATCHGEGVIKKQKTLSVKIPAGINHGNRIRLNSEGEAARLGGVSGDLYVQIHIKPHHIFQRDDNHLYCEVPIPFTIATLGGIIEVPTLTNKVKLKIPAGTQTSKLFRLKAKGVPSLRGGATGDLLCSIKVETPVNLNLHQKDLLKKFAESCSNNKKTHPESRSFFDTMRSFFEKK